MVGMSDKVFIVEASFDEDNENVPATIKFTNTDEGGSEDFATHYITQRDLEAGINNTRFDILLTFAQNCSIVGFEFILFLLTFSRTEVMGKSPKSSTEPIFLGCCFPSKIENL